MSRSAGKEGLSRRHRFSGRGTFAVALRSPVRIRSRHAVLHVAPGRSGASRLGLALAKRMARRSVDRNRIKRLAREAFRRHAVKAMGLDLVIVVRQPVQAACGAQWTAEVNDLLRQVAAGS